MDYDAQGIATADDGTRLYYGERGQGAPVLLLDGIGCDGWAWARIQPHLAERHRVVHTHYRGHGRSGPLGDPDRYDIATLVDDTRHVLDSLGIERAVPVAHSMGTQVALELYRAYPDRVPALALVCGSYGKITQTFHGNDLLHRALPRLIEQVQKHHGIARALWGRLPPALSFRVAGWLGEIDGPSLPAEDFKNYVEHLSDIDLDLYLRMLQRAGEHSAEDMLGDVRVPTLVVAAEKDTFTPRDVVKALADAIPGAEYVELAGASHAAPVERAEAINTHLDAFLDRLPTW